MKTPFAPFVHYFKGMNGVNSRCMVKIFSDDGDYFILFEDLDVGVSVTNASEQIATEVIKKTGYNPEDCRFFETYSQYNYDSLDEITYDWEYDKEKYTARNPSWKSAEEYREILLS